MGCWAESPEGACPDPEGHGQAPSMGTSRSLQQHRHNWEALSRGQRTLACCLMLGSCLINTASHSLSFQVGVIVLQKYSHLYRTTGQGFRWVTLVWWLACHSGHLHLTAEVWDPVLNCIFLLKGIAGGSRQWLERWAPCRPRGSALWSFLPSLWHGPILCGLGIDEIH